MFKFYKSLFSWMFFYVVDGEGGTADTWVDSIEDEGLKESLGQFESQEKFFEAIKYTPPGKIEVDWKDGLDEDLKKTADRFNSKEDAIRAIENFRKRESQVRVPGKDASEEEVANYYKAVGIPEKAEDYEFPEVDEITDEIKASREIWGQRFHDLKIPKETAKALSQLVNEDTEKMLASQIEADKEFAKTQEEALRAEWKDDFDKNKTLANRAFSDLAQRTGLNVEDLTRIETKDGRFLMDRAEMLKLFAAIGRETAEGTLGMSEGERDTIEDEIAGVRKQIAEAQDAGDSKKANSLYQKEQALLAKMGNKPIVGSQGRAA